MEYEDGPERDVLIYQLANHMKKSYLTWNKDSVDDILIFEDLSNISNGVLKPPGMELADVKAMPPKQQYLKQKGSKKGNQKKHH